MQGTGEPLPLSKILLIFWHMGYKMNHPPDHNNKTPTKADNAS